MKLFGILLIAAAIACCHSKPYSTKKTSVITDRCPKECYNSILVVFKIIKDKSPDTYKYICQSHGEIIYELLGSGSNESHEEAESSDSGMFLCFYFSI